MRCDEFFENRNPSNQAPLEHILYGISGVDMYKGTPPKNDPTSRRIINEDQTAIIRILENSPKR
jgi:hypothetical protein